MLHQSVFPQMVHGRFFETRLYPVATISEVLSLILHRTVRRLFSRKRVARSPAWTPPDQSESVLTCFSPSRPSRITAFEDTSHWNIQAEETYSEPINEPDQVGRMIESFRAFIGNNQMMAYLAMMAVRLKELHRVLKPTFILWIDPGRGATMGDLVKAVRSIISRHSRFLIYLWGIFMTRGVVVTTGDLKQVRGRIARLACHHKSRSRKSPRRTIPNQRRPRTQPRRKTLN
jgi:hypothetical protein